MDHPLLKQLAEIRKRALWLRARARDSTVVDDVVATGAVTRGADFEPKPKNRPWWRRPDEVPAEDPLASLRVGEAASLETIVAGEERRAAGRPFFLVRPVGIEIDAEATAEASAFARLRQWPDDTRPASGKRRRRMPPQLVPEIDPHRVLFLDLETAGLSASTYVFLCGMMFLEEDRLVVEQAFARDYDEEEGLLLHTLETMRRFDAIVTYNGATFDIPYLRTRMRVHRAGELPELASVDLLHAARRVFREILPNRRLVTVERHLRCVERVDDIPGRLIPDAWHDYVRSGDGRIMRNVLYHNRMDLFAMVVILNRLSDRPFEG